MSDGLYIPVATSLAVCFKAMLERDGYVAGFIDPRAAQAPPNGQQRDGEDNNAESTA